jgi:hypothetical protein
VRGYSTAQRSNEIIEWEEIMLSRVMLLGMVALAVTGCATGSGYAVDPRVGGDAAGYSMMEDSRQCEQSNGWFDRTAGVCDSNGTD